MNNKTKGFIYGAIAAASYDMNPLFALPLYAAGMRDRKSTRLNSSHPSSSRMPSSA